MTIRTVSDHPVATVYLGELEDGRSIEFVESIQPPRSRRQKWVLLVSTLFGCPVGCPMCDAGGDFRGTVSSGIIFEQIDYMIGRRYPDGHIPCEQFKIQFARMGEPAFNPDIPEVLDALPDRYDAPGLMPSISTVAPRGTDAFFERLLAIKRRHYGDGNFQLQFSIHTTSAQRRDELIPVRKWGFSEIAEFGERFHEPEDRKITLNFALPDGADLEADRLRGHFSPDRFLVKITPLNPTHRARQNELSSAIDPARPEMASTIVEALRREGFEVIVSIGQTEENDIGSNCGQYVRRHREGDGDIDDAYGHVSK